MEGDAEMEVEMEGEGLTVPPYTGCATPLMALTLPSPPQGVGVTVKEGVSKEVKVPPPLLPPPPHACTVMEGVNVRVAEGVKDGKGVPRGGVGEGVVDSS